MFLFLGKITNATKDLLAAVLIYNIIKFTFN
jgi:hypothetical protein